MSKSHAGASLSENHVVLLLLSVSNSATLSFDLIVLVL